MAFVKGFFCWAKLLNCPILCYDLVAQTLCKGLLLLAKTVKWPQFVL